MHVRKSEWTSEVGQQVLFLGVYASYLSEKGYCSTSQDTALKIAKHLGLDTDDLEKAENRVRSHLQEIRTEKPEVSNEPLSISVPPQTREPLPLPLPSLVHPLPSSFPNLVFPIPSIKPYRQPSL